MRPADFMPLAIAFALSVVIAAAGCGGAEAERPATMAAADRPSRPSDGHMQDAERSDKVVAEALPEPVARRLVASVEAISTCKADPQPDTLAKAFRSLATALELLPGSSRISTESIRSAADRLQSGATDLPGAAETTRNALAAVAQALTTVEPPDARREDFRVAVSIASAALDELDRHRRLEEQARPVVRGLRGAADAVLSAGGHTPHFGPAGPALPSGSADAIADCIGGARSAVRKLAATRYPHERAAVSAALGSLADCIAAAPGKTPEVVRLVTEIRFEAARIRAARALEPREALWVKAGLTSVVDALDALTADEPTRRDRGVWLDAARSTIRAIDGESGVTFQRGRVQDAFRATLDFLVAFAGPRRRSP